MLEFPLFSLKKSKLIAVLLLGLFLRKSGKITLFFSLFSRVKILVSKKLGILFGLVLPLLVNADLNLELPALNLPDIGRQTSLSSNAIPEKAHGLRILRELRGSGQIIDDPELNAWVRSLGNQLTSNAPSVATPYYFIISKDLSVNAFATIGGVIVVNAGLILQTKSESELAAVLAHEVAHITQRHIPRMIEDAESNKFVKGAALLAGVLASSRSPQAGQAVLTAAMATLIHKQLAFSRVAESEADTVGLRILARSGFDPKAMPSFLETLDEHNETEEEYREFLSNHPLSIKRISDTRVRAERFGSFDKKTSNSYLYMREKLRYVSSSNAQVPNILSPQIKKYSKAQWLVNNKDYMVALKTMGRNSSVVSEALLIAQLLNNQRRYIEAIAVLNPLKDIYLGNEALLIELAKVHLQLGQSHDAWVVINDVEISEQTSLEYFDVRQKVAQMTERNTEAYLAAAERKIRQGDYKSATLLLYQGIKQPDSNANQILKMQGLLTTMKALKLKEGL